MIQTQSINKEKSPTLPAIDCATYKRVASSCAEGLKQAAQALPEHAEWLAGRAAAVRKTLG